MRSAIAGVAGILILLAAAGASIAADSPAPATPVATASIPAASPKASVEATTIGDLVGNDKTKAVLQQDMPALLTYDGLDQIKGMTLRDISKYPQADLDQAKLVKIQKDFDAIPAP
jgi:hypothetical protein